MMSPQCNYIRIYIDRKKNTGMETWTDTLTGCLHIPFFPFFWKIIPFFMKWLYIPFFKAKLPLFFLSPLIPLFVFVYLCIFSGSLGGFQVHSMPGQASCAVMEHPLQKLKCAKGHSEL